ncbi:MAG: hypothetical protein BWY77_01091 [bacterium ADurb.Bin431]|nr:MAG: hypothetical protein BWY77_01091 [bacterium ADurb.Bin431]
MMFLTCTGMTSSRRGRKSSLRATIASQPLSASALPAAETVPELAPPPVEDEEAADAPVLTAGAEGTAGGAPNKPVSRLYLLSRMRSSAKLGSAARIWSSLALISFSFAAAAALSCMFSTARMAAAASRARVLVSAAGTGRNRPQSKLTTSTMQKPFPFITHLTGWIHCKSLHYPLKTRY